MMVVESLLIKEQSILVNHNTAIDIDITFNIPQDIKCDKISLTLKKYSPSNREFSGKRLLSKTDSGGVLKEQVPNFTPIRYRTPNMIEVKSHVEGSLARPLACSIVCVNTQDVLRRSDSMKNQKRESLAVREELLHTLSIDGMTLKAGTSTFNISSKVSCLSYLGATKLL